MDRALDPSLLSGALGDLENLPTPEELRRMLADAEVTAFFQTRGSLSPELVQTAWILHQVGTTSRALGLYGAERQVQANAVAAHIFDLALRDPGPPGYRLVLTFAAQVSSIRGDRMPALACTCLSAERDSAWLPASHTVRGSDPPARSGVPGTGVRPAHHAPGPHHGVPASPRQRGPS